MNSYYVVMLSPAKKTVRFTYKKSQRDNDTSLDVLSLKMKYLRYSGILSRWNAASEYKNAYIPFAVALHFEPTPKSDRFNRLNVLYTSVTVSYYNILRVSFGLGLC